MIYLIMFLAISCSIKKENKEWKRFSFFSRHKKNIIKKVDLSLLKPGDILIAEPSGGDIYGFFGHAAIYYGDNKTLELYVDFSKKELQNYRIGGFALVNASNWNERDVRVAILRYKNVNDSLREKIKEEMEIAIRNTDYGIAGKSNKDFGYCSQMISLIYENAGKKLGREIKLDYSKSFLAQTYEFLFIDELEIIDISEEG